MSLEDKIDRLTKAVEALTAVLLSQQQAAPVAQIKPQPATAHAKVETAPAATPQAESQTEDVAADLRTFIANISREKHENVRDRVRKVFKRFGAEKLSDVKESDHEELVKALTLEFYGEQI